jgi:hypothetical protein
MASQQCNMSNTSFNCKGKMTKKILFVKYSQFLKQEWRSLFMKHDD